MSAVIFSLIVFPFLTSFMLYILSSAAKDYRKRGNRLTAIDAATVVICALLVTGAGYGSLILAKIIWRHLP